MFICYLYGYFGGTLIVRLKDAPNGAFRPSESYWLVPGTYVEDEG